MKVIIIIMLVLVILLVGFSTNPSYEDYKEWYKSETYESTEVSTQLEKSIVGFVSGLAADTTVVREDYKIYSLYTSNLDNYNYKVLGIFNNFYVIKDEEIITTEN